MELKALINECTCYMPCILDAKRPASKLVSQELSWSCMWGRLSGMGAGAEHGQGTLSGRFKACRHTHTLISWVFGSADTADSEGWWWCVQVQSVVRAPSMGRQRVLRKKNPLTNLSTMLRLNPYAQTLRRMEHNAQVPILSLACFAPVRAGRACASPGESMLQA